METMKTHSNPTQPVSPVLDSIPCELKQLKIWVCFKIWLGKNDDGSQKLKADGSPKFEKRPVNPMTGELAESNDKETWGTFDQAVHHMSSNPARIKGIGIVMRDTHDYSAIDTDGCINEDGQINDDVKRIITRLDSFTELSASGRGIHIIFKGKIPGVGKPTFHTENGQEIEIFCHGQFLCITGIQPLGYESHTKIENRSSIFRTFFKELEKQKADKNSPKKAKRSSCLKDVDTFEDLLATKIIDFDAGVRKEFVSQEGNRGWQWEIPCPWKEEHSGQDGTSFISFFTNGTCAFHCFHAHCSDRKYSDLVKKFKLPAATFVDEFNATHAVVNVSGKVCVMNEFPNPDEPITFSSAEQFHTFYAKEKNEYVDAKGKVTVTKLSRAWMEHEDRRTYHRIVFEPGTIYPYDPKGYNLHNMFTGWYIIPSEQGDCDLFLKHVYHNVCAGNTLHYKYLTSWVARQIQDPGSDRPGVSVVIRGDKGTGKGIFAEAIMHLMNPYSVHVAQSGAVTSHFNKWLMNKILICADEAFFAGDKTDESQLKHIISDTRTLITPKGIDSFPIANYMNLLVLSNLDWAVPASANERRWFILDILNSCQQDDDYFGAILDQLRNGGYEKLMHYYQTYDYDMKLLRNPPLTQGLIDQKMFGLSPVEEFWYHCIEHGTIFRANSNGEILSHDDDWGDYPESYIQGSNNLKIDRQQVFDYFTKVWCRDLKKKWTKSLHAFVTDFGKLVPGLVNKQHRDGDSRKPFFVVQPFDECEKLWKQKLKGVEKTVSSE